MENINNKVLALKYRPKNFNELIGQDIMVKTINNSIKLNITTFCGNIFFNYYI